MNTTKVTDLSRTGEWVTERTGKYQATGLQEVDSALASRISAMFTNAVSFGDRASESRFASFLKRKPEDRVFSGKFDDVTQILKGIAQEKAGQKSKFDDAHLNGLALPVVNVSRTFDLSYENVDEGKSYWEYNAWRDDAGMPLADLLTQYVTLNYDVMLIAAEKETLALMCNTLAAALFSLTEHTLIHSGYLFNSQIPMQSAVTTPKSVAFSDMTPLSNGRIFAASLMLTVNAQVASAWDLNARKSITRTDLALRS
ncbi:hypothetical protein [Rosenbergiella collisarenosi]|uniref:hypothetical protein n=1 Tax=Rosenbergiella collisarenosi TaxID=1544695 RepID=UPI001F4EDEDF|nr:hypothetical protein [Rosenbergiella collisarenosi]